MEFTIGNDTFVIEDELKMKHLRKLSDVFAKLESDPFNSMIRILREVLVSFNGSSDVGVMEKTIDEYTIDQSTELVTKVSEIVVKQKEDKKK